MSKTATLDGLASTMRDAVRYHEAGQLDAAEALYERVLTQQRANFDALHLLGVCRHQRGDFGAAEKYLRAALKLRANAAAAHLNYGNTLRELKRLSDAIVSYSRAAALDPSLALAHFNLGTAMEEAGRYLEAIKSYERALTLNESGEARFGRANCMLALGRVDEAIEAYEVIARGQPAHTDVHANLGAALMQRQRHEEALLSVERALAVQPGHERAHLIRMHLLNELRRPGEALLATEGVIGSALTSIDALYQRARALQALQRSEEALPLYEAVLAKNPRYWEARFDRAAALTLIGRLDEAEASLDELHAERPKDVRVIFNRGIHCFVRGDLTGARINFEHALTIEPQMPGGRLPLSQLNLLEGRFTAGWSGYESRWEDPLQRAHLRSFAQPIWLGKDDISRATLFVHAEQGMGDTLQFCRYLPKVSQRAGRVLFEVPPALLTLLQRSLPAQIEVVPKVPVVPSFDRHCPLLSLPLAFQTTLETIPSGGPYLLADAARISVWRQRLGRPARLRIGLAWSGNANQARDRLRSMPLSLLLPLIQRVSRNGEREVEFVALQNHIRDADREALSQLPMLKYFGDAIEDFDDTAALAAVCDLIISVCTATAHLAGGLGRPLWVLLAFIPDWRWMLHRDDSPWYPSARLFRQKQLARWDEVVADVERRLEEFLAKREASNAGAEPPVHASAALIADAGGSGS